MFLPDAKHAQLQVVTHAQMLQLQTTGVVIDDSFFPVDQVEALRSYAIQQHEQGRGPALRSPPRNLPDTPTSWRAGGLQAAREVKLGDALQAAKAVGKCL